MQAAEVLVVQTPDQPTQNAIPYRAIAGNQLRQSSEHSSSMAAANAAIILFCYNRCASAGHPVRATACGTQGWVNLLCTCPEVLLPDNCEGLIPCHREGYLERTLRSLAALRGLQHFMVYISQDGDHPGVSRLIQGTGRDLMQQASARGFQHWQHTREPVLGPHQACTVSSNT